MKVNKQIVLFISVLVLIVVLIPLISACEATPTGNKTLKIGMLSWLGWPIGIDFKNGAELVTEITNKKGGLQVGNERYNLELIIYDSKMDPATAQAAVERLISQDQVKFILGEETVDAWLPITEAAKVLVVASSPTPGILSPDNKYAFIGYTNNTEAPIHYGWIMEHYPKIKTIVTAHPDNQIGHINGEMYKKLAQIFGQQMLEVIYYPVEATDFSAVGTKVKNLNPDGFAALAGGPISDGLCFKAARQAGYKGQFFAPTTAPSEVMAGTAGIDAVEGALNGAWDVELDLSPCAKEFKDAYIAKNGKWDNLEVLMLNSWYILTNALQKAGSTDVEKVASVIGSGMEYNSCTAAGKMISRPDMGNNKTIDTVGAIPMKITENGKPKLLAKISIEEGMKYCSKYFGWK